MHEAVSAPWPRENHVETPTGASTNVPHQSGRRQARLRSAACSGATDVQPDIAGPRLGAEPPARSIAAIIDISVSPFNSAEL
jgi:hypothetical protein